MSTDPSRYSADRREYLVKLRDDPDGSEQQFADAERAITEIDSHNLNPTMKPQQVDLSGPIPALPNYFGLMNLGYIDHEPKAIEVYQVDRMVNTLRVKPGHLLNRQAVEALMERPQLTVKIHAPKRDKELYLEHDRWLELGGVRGPEA